MSKASRGSGPGVTMGPEATLELELEAMLELARDTVGVALVSETELAKGLKVGSTSGDELRSVGAGTPESVDEGKVESEGVGVELESTELELESGLALGSTLSSADSIQSMLGHIFIA